jgi:hypothetical protein
MRGTGGDMGPGAIGIMEVTGVLGLSRRRHIIAKGWKRRHQLVTAVPEAKGMIIVSHIRIRVLS